MNHGIVVSGTNCVPSGSVAQVTTIPRFFDSPSEAGSSAHGEQLLANDFPNMPLLTEQEFLWDWVFYKYVAPTGLGFNSTPIRLVTDSAVGAKSL
jgi:hypothetical protein